MKKKSIGFTIMLVVLVIIAAYFIGSGLTKRTDVTLFNYSVSEDGTKLTMEVHAMSSTGYIRCVKPLNSKNHNFLVFYSTFGGFNSKMGAKNTFTITIPPDTTELYFNRANKSVELVLKKEEKTGQWKRPKDIVEEVNTIQEIENPDWGIVLTVENVSPTGLTLICTQNGGNPTGELATGSDYTLEIFDSGEWRELEYLPQKHAVAWTSVGYIISEEVPVEFVINWDTLYGSLEAGEYRIKKEVIDSREADEYYDTASYYAEFELPEMLSIKEYNEKYSN